MSNDSQTELLPCPFCGGTMEEVTDEDGHYFVHPGRVGLQRADCWLADAWVSDELTGEGSIGEWNARPSAPPSGEINADEWVEVTDGTTKEGDRFSYIANPETGVGQITSHKRRKSSGDGDQMRKALEASQKMLETVYRLNTHGSIGEFNWEEGGVGDLIKNQIKENRAALTEAKP